MGLRFPSYPPGVAAVISQEIPNAGTEDGGLRTEGAGPIVLDRVYASNLSFVVNGIHPHPVIMTPLTLSKDDIVKFQIILRVVQILDS